MAHLHCILRQPKQYSTYHGVSSTEKLIVDLFSLVFIPTSDRNKLLKFISLSNSKQQTSVNPAIPPKLFTYTIDSKQLSKTPESLDTFTNNITGLTRLVAGSGLVNSDYLKTDHWYNDEWVLLLTGTCKLDNTILTINNLGTYLTNNSDLNLTQDYTGITNSLNYLTGDFFAVLASVCKPYTHIIINRLKTIMMRVTTTDHNQLLLISTKTGLFDKVYMSSKKFPHKYRGYNDLGRIMLKRNKLMILTSDRWVDNPLVTNIG